MPALQVGIEAYKVWELLESRVRQIDKETCPGKCWQMILCPQVCALYLQSQRNPISWVSVPLSSPWFALISSQYSDSIQVLWKPFLYLLTWITPNIHTRTQMSAHAHTHTHAYTEQVREEKQRPNQNNFYGTQALHLDQSFSTWPLLTSWVR